VVDSEGYVYVPDNGYYSVRVFSSSGDFLTEVGRQGQGPGEFQSLSDVAIGARDSLFVYDDINRRISVFSPMPGPEFQHSIPVERSKRRGARKVFATRANDLFLTYVRSPRPSAQDQPGIWLVQIDRTGTIIADSLVHMPPKEMHVTESGDKSLGVRRPFGRHTAFRPMSDGRPCYGWTGDLHIRCLSTDGRDSTIFNYSYDPLEVTQADREEVYEWSDDVPGATAMIREAGWHDTHPAFEAFTVSHEDRFWIRRPSHADEDRNAWNIVDPVEETVRSLTLPENEAVAAVRNGKAFGLRWSEEKGTRLIIYDTEE